MEKNKVMMIVIIVLLVTLLVTIVGVFFYTLQIVKTGGNLLGEDGAEELVQEIPKLSVDQISKINLSSTIRTDLRVSDDGQDHMVQLTVTIGYNNTDKKESPLIQKLLEENDAMNKDLVLSILRSKTYEELKQGNGFEILKDELLTKLRERYESNLIYSVYFSDIILQ